MRQKRGKAFTIVELVIVIAVIAILAAVLIPTFSSVIKKAKISADQQTAANINTALSAYAVENGIDGTEDLYKAISDLYGDSFQQVLQPQSASYGYHFWYDVQSNRIEVAQSSALGSAAVQAVARAFRADDGENYGLRGMVKEGYVLLDRGGSGLAEAVASFEGMSGASDYASARQNLQGAASDKYDAAAVQDFSAAVEKTAIVADHGVFRGKNADQIVFDTSVQTLTGVLFEYEEGDVTEYSLGGEKVVAEVSGKLSLPASVTSVGSNALYFGADADVVISVSADTDIASVFLADSVDVAIS